MTAASYVRTAAGILVSATATLVLTAGVAGQSSADALVHLEMRALDANRRPVSTLDAASVTLTVDDVPRPITTFEFVPTPRDRTILLVFDEQTISDDRSAQDAAAALIARLDPSDRVGLVSMAGPSVAITTERQPVLRALTRIGEWPASRHDRTCRSPDGVRPILLRLTDFLETLIAVPGPKTVVFVSGGVPAASTSAIDCAVMLQNVTRAVALAQVTMYVVESRPGPATSGLFGLQDLAAVTGGPLFRFTETARRAFEQISAELGGYYRIGFEALTAERDGARHTIQVTSTDPAVAALRIRRWFVISGTGLGALGSGHRD